MERKTVFFYLVQWLLKLNLTIVSHPKKSILPFNKSYRNIKSATYHKMSSLDE